MRWSERQLAMLREMGIRVWAPEAPAAIGRTQAPRRWSRSARRSRRPRAPRRWRARRRRPTTRGGPSGAGVPAGCGRRRTPIAPGPLVSAEWLVVGEPFASTAADPAAAAEQELLLDNMLRAIRVSRGSEVSRRPGLPSPGRRGPGRRHRHGDRSGAAALHPRARPRRRRWRCSASTSRSASCASGCTSATAFRWS